MKASVISGLFAAATVTTGLFAGVESASATSFTWNNSWTQPTIKSKAQTGFDDAPFQQFVQAEGLEIKNSGQFKLDPSKLFMKYAHDVNVFFINEGAGYRNQLAFQATGGTNQTGLVFNDIACDGPGCIGAWGGNTLKLGDGVNLGKMNDGTQLDFKIKANGYWGGKNIFGTQVSDNEDGLQHVVAYAYNNYVVLGFEDLFGDLYATGGRNERSDRDFNDVVMVLDIGERNVKEMMGIKTAKSTPEPSVAMSLGAVAAIGMYGLRRRRKVEPINTCED